MFKSIGLGIACLTLTVSGVTRATAINVDCGKYGDDKCIKLPTDCKPDIKCLDFLPVCDDKSDGKDCIKDNNNDGNKDCHIVLPICLDEKGCLKDPCDLKLKPIVDCDDHKIVCDDKDGHGKDTCKLDFCDNKHEPVLCDIGNNCDKGHGECDLVIDCNSHGPSYCDNGGCDPHGMCVPCDPPPAAVPAPASAAFGGLGVIGIMLMAGLRSRRSAAI
jgi:hypothetical protein